MNMDNHNFDQDELISIAQKLKDFELNKQFDEGIKYCEELYQEGLYQVSTFLATFYGYKGDFLLAEKWARIDLEIFGIKPKSCFTLALILFSSELSEKIPEGLKYLQSAVDMELPSAILYMSELYYLGKFVKKDLYKAEQFAKKTAKLGYPYSLRMLSCIYLRQMKLHLFIKYRVKAVIALRALLKKIRWMKD